ncbi:MAG TPA: hypothetical protein VNV35_03755, partial [Puia sp.]|nr:hypothetical protein [Puia sp.]
MKRGENDFINDPFFQDWARTLLESVHFVEQFPSDEQVEQSLASARERIAEGGGRVVALPLDRQRG